MPFLRLKIYITLIPTFTHYIRNIVLKLFDDKCRAKACEIFNTIILDMLDGLIFKKWYFFMR